MEVDLTDTANIEIWIHAQAMKQEKDDLLAAISDIKKRKTKKKLEILDIQVQRILNRYDWAFGVVAEKINPRIDIEKVCKKKEKNE